MIAPSRWLACKEELEELVECLVCYRRTWRQQQAFLARDERPRPERSIPVRRETPKLRTFVRGNARFT